MNNGFLYLFEFRLISIVSIYSYFLNSIPLKTFSKKQEMNIIIGFDKGGGIIGKIERGVIWKMSDGFSKNPRKFE